MCWSKSSATLAKKLIFVIWWLSGHVSVHVTIFIYPLFSVCNKLKEKYPTLVRRRCALFQQDNAKPYTVNKTKEKFDEVEVLTLCHPITASFGQWGTFYMVVDSSHLIKLRKRARSSSIRSEQSGTSIESGCL